MMNDYLSRQPATMAPHRAILRAVECRLMGAVDLKPPILDIGCGEGHFASIAYADPVDVGIDLRPEEVGEAAACGHQVYWRVMGADATELPFGDRVFATAASNSVLEHIPDVDAVLGEISRVLAPGGVLVTTVPSEHFADYLFVSTALRRIGFEGLARASGDWFNRISYHQHVDPPSVWRDRFSDAGLEVVDHQYYFSARAHRAFDLCHYAGVPNLVSRKLTGRWVFHPAQARVFERWLRRFYDEPVPQPLGAYQYFRCVRTS